MLEGLFCDSFIVGSVDLRVRIIVLTYGLNDMVFHQVSDMSKDHRLFWATNIGDWKFHTWNYNSSRLCNVEGRQRDEEGEG